MQEDPTNIPEGETPRSLLMYAFDTNVDACKPGDRVTITGKLQTVSCLVGATDMLVTLLLNLSAACMGAVLQTLIDSTNYDVPAYDV